ncbi:MAG: tyrosine-type recombinase/integrase [Desulfobacteraceae bacterium]|nr:tyrosine-type recombinase/integrase [Desulfobacteraceae bacterium]
MEKVIGNPNHPQKGSRIEVDPIRNEDDIKKIKQLLIQCPRNYLLFVLGINNGIRVGDLLKLRVGDLRYLKIGQVHQIIEGKTGKKNVIIINKSVRNALDKFMKETDCDTRDYLFKSAKGENSPITINHVNKLVKQWTDSINLKQGNYGSHTLRKTWGYQQRIKFGVGFEVLCKRYNHSSPAVTMRYLGIEDKEEHGILMNEI